MKKIFFIIFNLFFIVGCQNKKGNQISSSLINDSISFYLKEANNKKNSQKRKIAFLDKSFRLIKVLKNDLKNRDTLFKISYNYYVLKEWQKFNITSNYLLKKAEEGKDSVNIAKAYRYKANFYKKTEIYDSSFYYYLKAQKIYLKSKDNLNYANILYNKGIVQFKINEFFGSELSLSKAYYILKETNEYDKLYGILNQLGLVCNELKEYDRSIIHLNNALEIVKKHKINSVEHQETVCLSNIGYVYFCQDKLNNAINYYEKSLLDRDIKIDSPVLYSNILDNLAYCKLNTNNFKDLPRLFFESLNIREEINNSSSKVISYNHISEYYFKIKNYKLANEYSNKALRLAKLSKNPIDIITALKQASIVDKKNSSKYSEGYIRISDSLQLEERKNKDRFARIELETDELRQENTQLSEQNRDILNYFMIAIVFGGFLFFARFQRLKARELALKQTQQQANEEIYRLIISHQNQLEEGRDLEKKRISKELHDGVLGRLFGLRLNLDGLNNFDDDETKQQRLDYLNELKIIEQDLREISHELSRENLVLINNFVAIINNLLEQQTKINTAKINTLISDKIDWEKVSNTIKINLYRILQESLQNINKHAEAKTINIIFNKDSKGNLIFSIEDDGKGYNTNGKKTKGIGVNNIVDRVHQCQGKIDIKSQIGKGTKIIITFPLENETINM